MRFLGFGAVIGLLLIALIGGVIGYNTGLSAGIAASGAQIAYPVHGFGFGGFGGLFGLLVFFILIMVVIGAFRRAAWGHRGWGHHGYGMYGRHGWDDKSSSRDSSSWGDRPVPPFADEMLQRWHSQAHGQPDAAGHAKADQPKPTDQA